MLTSSVVVTVKEAFCGFMKCVLPDALKFV